MTSEDKTCETETNFFFTFSYCGFVQLSHINVVYKGAWDAQSADLSDSMNTDHTLKALEQDPESLFSV